jgi:hypothetical protein
MVLDAGKYNVEGPASDEGLLAVSSMAKVTLMSLVLRARDQTCTSGFFPANTNPFMPVEIS